MPELVKGHAAGYVDLEQGLISRRIFFEPDLYRQELERIFARCWLYLGHDSQIPDRGDFVTAYMGEDPIILCRGADGNVRAFLNSCRHRGMKVCRADRGNARQFTCSFHGWTYNNAGELRGVPLGKEYYGDRLKREAWGLLEVPKLAEYGGFWFGSWDAGAQSLDDYLGNFRWYLDIFIERCLGGVELVPGTQRYALSANWKIASENFAGDTYHLPYSHGSAYRLEIRQLNPGNPLVFGDGTPHYNIACDNGHGMTGMTFEGQRYAVDLKIAKEMGPEIVEYVEACYARVKERLSPQQAGAHALNFGNIFPNFSINDFGCLRPTGLYVWHPKGPMQFEAWQWCAMDRDAPQAVKDMVRIDFSRAQSTGGIVAQDDTENFEQVTEATRGVVGQRLDFNYQMNIGQGDLQPLEGVPGRFSPGVSETNQLNFYARWAELIDEASVSGAKDENNGRARLAARG